MDEKTSQLNSYTKAISSDILPIIDTTNSLTKQITKQNLAKGLKTATFLVAASNAADTSGADYICTGTSDDVTIQSAINALPSTGGKIVLSDGSFNIASTIQIFKGNVTIEGQGIGATTINTPPTVTGIQFGNRQSDGILRNFNHLFDLTVSVNSGSQTAAGVKIDGGGRGTSMERVQVKGGNYCFEFMDLDRCYFANLDAGNPVTAGFFCEVGKENTYGTCVFLNCSVALSNNTTYGWLFDANADQVSPNSPDRITIINTLFFMSGGLTGCVGLYFKGVSATSFNCIGSLFEQNNRHVRWDTGGGTYNFLGCTFLDSNNVCTDCFYMTNSASLTVRDCRFQQATNVFNAVSNPNVSVCVDGINNNQGNLTNIWTGSFTKRWGTDASFAGDTNLVSGIDNQRFDSVFANHWRGHPNQIKPSSDVTNALQFQNSGGTILGQMDSVNTRFYFGGTSLPNSKLQAGGAFASPIFIATVAGTLGETDSTWIASGTPGTLTLPNPSGIAGRQYFIKNIDPLGTLHVQTVAGSIDGQTDLKLIGQYTSAHFQTDGTVWYVLAQVGTAALF